MGMLSNKLRNAEGGGLRYWCQGCEEIHGIQVGDGPGPRWGWNGNVDAPTFTPSVLVTWETSEPPVTPENLDQWRAQPWEQHKVKRVCHTFVTDGMVQFLGDCTHQFAGQTLPLPDLPEAMRD